MLQSNTKSSPTETGVLDKIKLKFQVWYDAFMWRYGEERIEFARNRLRVHKLNMAGECQFNPYTEPDSDWFDS